MNVSPTDLHIKVVVLIMGSLMVRMSSSTDGQVVLSEKYGCKVIRATFLASYLLLCMGS